MVSQHVTVGSLSDSPQVRRDFIPPLAQVHLDDSLSVNWEPLVGVHNNTEQARVGVDQLSLIPSFQVPIDRSIIEEGQVGHVLALLELWWIDLTKFMRLVGSFL